MTRILAHPGRPTGDKPALSRALGESDAQRTGPAQAEAVHVSVDDLAADELRAALEKPGERLVDVVHGDPDAEAAESVRRSVTVIGDHGRVDEARVLEPTVAVHG